MDGQATTEMDLFLSALEIAGDEQRRAFLDQACSDDRRLRQDVDALLAAHDRLPSDEAALGDSADLILRAARDDDHDAQAGASIGPYKLLEPIGEGGMAVVFLAEQKQPIQRKVALKLVKPGMDSRQIIARFQAERQALALMDHPNIAKVFEAGTTAKGRPFFAMELVKGVPITGYCDDRSLPPRARLELFVDVCQAVQHAHQKGIIHRDIKPTNVLIAPYDGKPVPKVIDFGVAKALGQQLTEQTMFTGFGAVIGTLEYMSPEQAELNQLDIDTRSDIYSLGVLLYELLTGTTPLEHDRLKRSALDETLRRIRHEEPPRPSTRLSTMDGEALPSVAAQRALDPKKLTSVVRGELDWIVMKALEKDRARRYQTASDLAMDVERYLHGQMVLACPPSASYRMRKFARRHLTGLVATAAAFAGLVVLVGVLAASNMRVARERNDKAAALLDAQAQRDEKAVALRDAQLQRERAERNFLSARRSVSRLMAQPAAGFGEWQTLPKSLRKKFADEAVDYYNSLLQEDTVDPSLRYETAVGYRSIGFMRQRVGEHSEARTLALKSIEMLEALSKQDPANREYRQQLAWSRMLLGWNLNLLDQPAEAEAEFKQAATLLQQLLAEAPKNSSYTTELGQCYGDLAGTCEKRWAAMDVEQVKREGLSLIASLPSDLPHACVVYDRVAAALGARGLVDDAFPLHLEALARLVKMQEYGVDTNELDSLRLKFRSSVANTLVSGNRGAEAVILMERDAARSPGDLRRHNALGEIHARLGQWDRAAAAFTKCLDLNPAQHEPWYSAAAVYLGAGDTEGYRRACRGMMERFNKPNIPIQHVERTLRTCALAPGAVEDFAAVELLAERLVSSSVPGDQHRLDVLAAALVECRARRYSKSVEWLARLSPSSQGACLDAVAFSTLAMARHGLGDRTSAQTALASADALVAKHTPDPAKGQSFQGPTSYIDWLHATALRREAEKLLAQPPLTPPPAPQAP